METNTRNDTPSSPWLNPLAGWDAATRWNAATFDWMTRGFRQWMSLMSAPFSPFAVNPLQAGAEAVRDARHAANALDTELHERIADAPQATSRAVADRAKPAAAERARSKRAARPSKAGTRTRSRG